MTKVGSKEPSVKSRFIKRVIDCGNRRYAASQASTYCGGLITGLHFKRSIKPIDEEKEKLKTSIDAVEKTADESVIENQEEIEGENIDGNQQTIDVDEDGEEKVDELTYADNESLFFAKLREEARLEEDAATVASTAPEGVSHFESGIPTTYFNRRAVEFNEKLHAERAKRQLLEGQIEKMRAELSGQKKQIEMQGQGEEDLILKMKKIDMRNCLTTGQNYTSHP